MNSNQKLGEQIAILASVDPSSQGVGAVTSAWVPVALFHRFCALIDVGAVGGGGTVTVAIQQATSNAGAGAKAVTNAVTGVALTVPAITLSNSQAIVDVLADWVDSTNGYGFIAVTLTVAVNAVLTQALLLGHAPRLGPASLGNQAGVVAVV